MENSTCLGLCLLQVLKNYTKVSFSEIFFFSLAVFSRLISRTSGGQDWPGSLGGISMTSGGEGFFGRTSGGGGETSMTSGVFWGPGMISGGVGGPGVSGVGSAGRGGVGRTSRDIGGYGSTSGSAGGAGASSRGVGEASGEQEEEVGHEDCGEGGTKKRTKRGMGNWVRRQARRKGEGQVSK